MASDNHFQLFRARHLAAARLHNAKAAQYEHRRDIQTNLHYPGEHQVLTELAEAERACAMAELALADMLLNEREE